MSTRWDAEADDLEVALGRLVTDADRRDGAFESILPEEPNVVSRASSSDRELREVRVHGGRLFLQTKDNQNGFGESEVRWECYRVDSGAPVSSPVACFQGATSGHPLLIPGKPELGEMNDVFMVCEPTTLGNFRTGALFDLRAWNHRAHLAQLMEGRDLWEARLELGPHCLSSCGKFVVALLGPNVLIFSLEEVLDRYFAASGRLTDGPATLHPSGVMGRGERARRSEGIAVSNGAERVFLLLENDPGRLSVVMLQGEEDRNTEVMSFDRPSRGTPKLAASADGEVVAVAYNLEVRVGFVSGGEVLTLDHIDELTDCVVTPGGEAILTAAGGVVRIFSTSSGKCFQVIMGAGFFQCVGVDPQGLQTFCGTFDGEVFATGFGGSTTKSARKTMS
jgi:hypothetical protein